jgi:myo-inositol catabolism protein IolC
MLEPVYMLAIDHRWQWEEWCDANKIDRARIPEIKVLAAEAFLAAREASEDLQRSGALLVDLTYGRRAFEIARAAGAVTGTPAERAGAFPLEWTAPFDEALPGDFVKVLVRHRADVPSEVVDEQRRRLLELQRWCRVQHKPLVLEVLVSPPTSEPATDFESHGRPRLLAAYIRDAYAVGLVPAYWKIEGMPDRATLAVVDQAIRSVEGPKQLILGKGAGMTQVRQWFDATVGAPSAAGFAIGRTVYFEQSAQWVAGRLPRGEAIIQIAANYVTVAGLWQRFAVPSAS